MSSSTAAERFGRFHLLHRIAVGGMAEIYLAHARDDLDPRGLVVIKRLRAALEKDPDFVRMFLDESAVISRLDHPGIICVRDFGDVGGRHFIALDHVWGESLATLTTLCTRKRLRFPMGAALHIGAQTAAALHHAHSLRDEAGSPSPVIHRDVTLGNVMVAYDGVVKVLDFGIAKADERLAQTRVGQIKGTLIYLAPEQLRGAPVSPATDVYQLGVLLYKTLVGCEPFAGRSEIEVMEAIVAGHAIKPSQRIPDFPPAIEAVLAKAMARRDSQRFTSMEQLAVVLRALLGDAFADSAQRLAGIVAQITGDRAVRQRKYIDGLLDGLEVDRADGELIRWGNVGDEPRTLSVELSHVLEVERLDEPSEPDTQVTSLAELLREVEGDAGREDERAADRVVELDADRDSPAGADVQRTEVVPMVEVQAVIAAGDAEKGRRGASAGEADGTGVFESRPPAAVPAADLFRSEAVLAHVTRPDLPDFARLLEAEALHGSLGAFEEEPPPTVPLSALDPLAAVRLGMPELPLSVDPVDPPLLRSADSGIGETFREVSAATAVARGTPRPAPPPVPRPIPPAPAADDDDGDVFQAHDDLEFDIDVMDED